MSDDLKKQEEKKQERRIKLYAGLLKKHGEEKKDADAR